MNRARADALLLFVALIWGTTFVAQKQASAHIGPVLFVALRFVLAAVLLAPLAVRETRASIAPLQRADWMRAGVISLCLCAGCWIQQTGVGTTSATNAGFMTAVYMVAVPFVAWRFSGQAPRTLVLAACAVALLGAWLLGGGNPRGAWSRGDFIILAGDFVWAAHITLVGRCRTLAARPVLLSFVQCALTGLLSLPVALIWQPPTLEALRAAAPAIAYAGVLSSALAFTLQIVAQRYTPAAEAALIMSLESVFAAIGGALVLHEMLGLRAAIGAVLILLGVVLTESGPLLRDALPGLRARLQARRRSVDGS